MLKHISAAIVGAALVAAPMSVAFAQGFDATHPARDQVNNRMDNTSQKINRDVAKGEIDKRQAARLHHENHMVRTAERTDSHLNGSHITQPEHKALNQEETALQRKTYNEAH